MSVKPQWGIVGGLRPGVEVMEVVCTRLEQRGDGTEEDPIRKVTQYWSKNGKLLAEVDDLLQRHHLDETKRAQRA